MTTDRKLIAAALERAQNLPDKITTAERVLAGRVIELARVASDALDEVERYDKEHVRAYQGAQIQGDLIERLAAVARTTKALVPLAKVGASASRSASSHQEFIREDTETWEAAENALAALHDGDMDP